MERVAIKNVGRRLTSNDVILLESGVIVYERSRRLGESSIIY